MSEQTETLRRAASLMRDWSSASWHPAVADWLETVADRIEHPDAGFILGSTDRHAALYVATTYLAESA